MVAKATVKAKWRVRGERESAKIAYTQSVHQKNLPRSSAKVPGISLQSVLLLAHHSMNCPRIALGSTNVPLLPQCYSKRLLQNPVCALPFRLPVRQRRSVDVLAFKVFVDVSRHERACIITGFHSMNRPDKVPSRQCNPGTEGFAVLGFRITLRFGVAWAARVPKMLGLSDAFPYGSKCLPRRYLDPRDPRNSVSYHLQPVWKWRCLLDPT